MENTTKMIIDTYCGLAITNEKFSAFTKKYDKFVRLQHKQTLRLAVAGLLLASVTYSITKRIDEQETKINKLAKRVAELEERE